VSALSDLEVLVIEHACTQLVVDFAFAIDRKEFAKLASIFDEAATYTRPIEPDIVVRGRDNILRLFDSRPPDRITIHLYSNIRIEVLSADRARGSSRIALIAGSTNNEKHPQFGHKADPRQLYGGYEDEFVKTTQGWRILNRRGYVQLHT
jgi:hypothetical protein